jgi:cytochrome c oxidase subunit 2
MTGVSLVVWLLVAALALYAVYGGKGASLRSARRLIVWGGAVLPTLLLTVLLAFGLAAIPPLLAPPPPGSRTIVITGEQWWWRVRYPLPDGTSVELANELRLAVGEPVELLLQSADVIHSLWIPALAGKMDVIPGRTTRLTLEPTRAGELAGLCAEYCGDSHSFMELSVVVSTPQQLTDWLAQQAQPAQAPASALAARGRERLLSSGCGACHSVRGTPADGVVGPDLTHVGSRLRIAGGRLMNDERALRDWLARTGELKPGAVMPSFHMLPEQELDALAAYLGGLK